MTIITVITEKLNYRVGINNNVIMGTNEVPLLCMTI